MGPKYTYSADIFNAIRLEQAHILLNIEEPEETEFPKRKWKLRST